MRIPLNRVVAFAGPYIALAASGVAAWLVAKVNVLGVPGLDQHNVATWLAAAGTAGLTAGLHALGGWGWLKGHHIELAHGIEPGAALDDPELDDPRQTDAPAVPTLEQHSHLGDPS